MKGKLLLAGVPAQDRLHEYFSLFGDNGKVSTPEGVFFVVVLRNPKSKIPHSAPSDGRGRVMVSSQ